LSSNSYAFEYFDREIDYWKEAKPPPLEPKKEEVKLPQVKENQPPKNERFDWAKYKDPNNPEFFKEGDHTPPEPFMELARDPSDENIRQWFALIESKNELMGNLSKRMMEFSAKHQSSLNTEERGLIAQKESRLQVSAVDYKRFRFRLYFDSVCPHCKDMMGTMVQLQEQGFYVEVKQIDKKRPDYQVPFPIAPATPEELKEKKISAWPVLFVADTQKKLVYRINGYLSSHDVLKTLASRK
jgi:thiol-disulfide isomerase/thioredoxin